MSVSRISEARPVEPGLSEKGDGVGTRPDEPSPIGGFSDGTHRAGRMANGGHLLDVSRARQHTTNECSEGVLEQSLSQNSLDGISDPCMDVRRGKVNALRLFVADEAEEAFQYRQENKSKNTKQRSGRADTADTSRGESREPKASSASDRHKPPYSFYEFFAGGGMARAGLGENWRFLFGNDYDFKKSATYKDNWGDSGFLTKDVAKVQTSDLPGTPDLVWASFPCQDLSLAGMGAGLKGDRSGTFWPFWNLMKTLRLEQRGPRIIVLENVCGTLTSHGGRDFTAIADALADEDYQFGAMVIDAVDFVPQSRPRLFIIAIDQGVEIPRDFLAADACLHWHPKALQAAHLRLTGKAREKWRWWNLPRPPHQEKKFADLVEESPIGVSWHSKAETEKLLKMMSDGNLEKMTRAKKAGRRVVGTIYKRTRFDPTDQKVQRAEVRFDDVAGCLRTASGGSSRQLVIVVNGDEVRSRLLSSREAARLMGLGDDYKLPKAYNEAYHLMGDGVVVPVVRHLAENLLEAILDNSCEQAIASNEVRHPMPGKQ